ncbi:MAG: hypothetical protein JKX84_08595, partial [Flavobacteriales bacterium]|nr:hypothetical protein [Flavobacteriales bacterium]
NPAPIIMFFSISTNSGCQITRSAVLALMTAVIFLGRVFPTFDHTNKIDG